MHGSEGTQGANSFDGLPQVEGTHDAAVRPAGVQTMSVEAGKKQAAVMTADALAAASRADADVRLAKVWSLKAAIEAGTYKVSAGEVADRIILHLLS